MLHAELCTHLLPLELYAESAKEVEGASQQRESGVIDGVTFSKRFTSAVIISGRGMRR